jgi:hypothetical protein
MEHSDSSVRNPGIKVPRRLDKLVEKGRITTDEADRLQAGDTDALVEIRVRHARASLDGAVAAGQVTREEADRLLARLRAGEHPTGLRAELNRLVGREKRER